MPGHSYGSSGPLPPRYIQSLEFVRVSAAAVSIGVGVAKSDDDTCDINVTATIPTVSLAVAGVNGLDAGAEAADTGYYLWLIADRAGTNAPAGLWSLSSSAPVLPAGYDKKQRIGWWYNTAASDLREGQMLGRSGRLVDFEWWDTRANLAILTAGSALAYAAVGYTAFAPATAIAVDVGMLFTADGLTNQASIQPGAFASAGFPLNWTIGAGATGALTSSFSSKRERLYAPGGSLLYRVTAAADTLDLWVEGYVDDLDRT
jgi:hypothetical protein